MGDQLMIDLGSFESCVYIRRGEPSDSCADRLVLQEKRKKVTLRPKHKETAKLLVLDGSVFRDNLPKCDGMFFYEKRSQLYVILVELKEGDIDHVFGQIKYRRENRKEFTELRSQFR